MSISNYESAIFLTEATNNETINVNAASRLYWKLTPTNDVRLYVYGLRIFAGTTGAISTYATFLGVSLTSDTEIRIEISHDASTEHGLGVSTTSAFDFSDSHLYGLRSIGDAIASSVIQPTVLSVNPGCVTFDISFGKGLVLNGYDVAAGKTSDYIAISHKANLSGLNYMKACVLVSRLSLP